MAFNETKAPGRSQTGVSDYTFGGAQPSERWLLLTDFASKHRISVSTLRRRIKNGSQAYRFENGKYFLPDVVEVSPSVSAHVSETARVATVVAVAESSARETLPTEPSVTAAEVLASTINRKDEPLITTTSNLLNELKQAYTLILHEKEEQIVFLKEEIADLKTLVRVLESENARLVADRERFERERGELERRERPIRSTLSPSKNPFGTA